MSRKSLIAQHVHKRMIELGLNQSQLGRLASVNPSMLSRLLSGVTQNVSDGVLMRLAPVLECSFEDLRGCLSREVKSTVRPEPKALVPENVWALCVTLSYLTNKPITDALEDVLANWFQKKEEECRMDDEVRIRWIEGCYIEQLIAVNFLYHGSLPWVPYEGYMKARLLEAVVGKPGRLVICFPADSAEDEEFHVHPTSDRVVTVLEGSGKFVAIRNFQKIEHDLVPGMRVWMPRGVVHNFFGGPEGLLVDSQHLPFIPFNDPLCFVRVRVD